MRKICYGMFLTLIIFLFFLPNFLSSSLGTQLLVSFLGKKIQLTKLHLSWFGRQKILQLEIIKQNQPWFSSPEVTIDNPLISLLLFHKLKIEAREPKLLWGEKPHSSPTSLQSHTKPKNYFDLFNCIQTLRVINGSFKVVP